MVGNLHILIKNNFEHNPKKFGFQFVFLVFYAGLKIVKNVYIFIYKNKIIYKLSRAIALILNAE